MRHILRVVAVGAFLGAISCTRSEPESEPGSTSGSGDESGSSADVDAEPIQLTDARLDKYIAYRKELARSYAQWSKGAVELAKSVDSRSTDIGKGLTAAAGALKLGERYEKELTALRAKHGFTEAEDDRLWSAVSDVLAAKVLDNPGMEDGLKAYREMQARGGEEKKAADEILKGFEDQEKQGLAEARTKYGDACVAILSKRSRELGQLQLDFVKLIAGQQEPEPR